MKRSNIKKVWDRIVHTYHNVIDSIAGLWNKWVKWLFKGFYK